MGNLISWLYEQPPQSENKEELQDYEFVPPPPPLKRQIGYQKQLILDCNLE